MTVQETAGQSPVDPAIADTLAIAREEERLRQESLTFDQRRSQDRSNFILRMAMGWMAVVMLPAIGLLAGYVILNEERFTNSVVTLASTALLADILGVVLTVWRVTFGTKPPPLLNPVTPASGSGSPETQ